MPSQTTGAELPEGYTLLTTPPPLENYLGLRKVTGLTPKSAAQGSGALSGSWYFVHLVFNSPFAPSSSQVVGMGRLIGDGGWYFHVCDMAVHPDHQRKGLGDFILKELLRRVDEVAPDQPYVNLVADPPGVKLYKRHGFEETATTGRGGVGMQRYQYR